ncbi:MAG: Ubiquitin-conjugating enzyme E2 6 [Trizodia sp. TS-e1964]|nr:MAG: Ubiquitin-conjugating enzyme E2 6 [Trizodia sp. TS-e1964]
MATPAANKRLTREYKIMQNNPTPYITAHPSDTNILEWHYILTGPPQTPYHNGQYWGVLLFPPNYPFAPPSIRMHTPSARFQPSTRLCLSISDFHPKSFNPAWEVSTILIGLLSFMTSEEMTTGSIAGTDAERAAAAARSRWWNSTGGGSLPLAPGTGGGGSNARGVGAVMRGDGGLKFRAEWPALHAENWAWMTAKRVDMRTGLCAPEPRNEGQGAEREGLREHLGVGVLGGGGGAVAGAQGRVLEGGQSWLMRNRLLVGLVLVFGYVLIARFIGEVSSA